MPKDSYEDVQRAKEEYKKNPTDASLKRYYDVFGAYRDSEMRKANPELYRDSGAKKTTRKDRRSSGRDWWQQRN